MNDLLNFENDEFGEITVINDNEEYKFIGKEIAEKLEYKDHVNALKRHVDDEDKEVAKYHPLGKGQAVTIINESGLYSLILASKKKRAKSFKRWLTKEVIPSIRKDGFYILPGKEKNAYDYIQELHADDKNVFKVLADIVTYASDYDKNDDRVKWLFASIRNEIYKVTTGYVASDIVYTRANHKKELMGLTTCTGKKGPTKKDVVNAKLYLYEKELEKVVKATNLSVEFAKTTMLLNEDYTIDDFILQWNTIMQGFNKGKEIDLEPEHNRKEANEHAIDELEKYRGLITSKELITC